MRNPRIKAMVVGALIAAIYTVLGYVLAPMNFGPIQLRVGEALTLLAVFSPVAVWGVTLGCLLTNVIGVALGATMVVDIVFGTLATLLAAICSYCLRNVTVRGLPLLSALSPVVFNMLIIGAELTLFFSGSWNLGIFAINALTVGAGEVIACFVLGLPLVWALRRIGFGEKFFQART